jgi:hypothetical protein
VTVDRVERATRALSGGRTLAAELTHASDLIEVGDADVGDTVEV